MHSCSCLCDLSSFWVFCVRPTALGTPAKCIGCNMDSLFEQVHLLQLTVNIPPTARVQINVLERPALTYCRNVSHRCSSDVITIQFFSGESEPYVPSFFLFSMWSVADHLAGM